ncbi:DUF2065 domain-containing protein [Sutterella sp.]|uniref:DUF2065 domain-containing protein n=1 Tax=Sutterella sp. TaxID=1981025 RepID=UPI0026DF38FC|nr:DUF2065 domain-containing protein [Sutterella sp.]MDO5530571.1 DUF2065 domain-containing protein [Sutterella sp.]
MSGWEILGLAFGWVMIIEGITPLIAPDRWREAIEEISRAPSSAVRAAAAVIVTIGLLIVWAFLGQIPDL